MTGLRRLLLATLAFGLGTAVGFTAFQLWWLEQLLGPLEPLEGPRRYYTRPVRLEDGARFDRAALTALLRAAGYREAATGAGSFRWDAPWLRLRTRRGDRPAAAEVRLALRSGRLRAARPVTLAPVAFAEDAGSASRRWLPLAAMPETLLRLVQAVEDRRFARHGGFDWRGIARAAIENLRAGRWVEGGSTITQQLVKDRYLGNERSLWRKYNEALLAVLLERRFGKAEILETYLNDAYLGQRGATEIRGFPRAAEHYFGRALDELAVHELALLVGLLRGPSWYQPWRHPQRARERRSQVLAALWRTGWLSRSALRRLEREPLGLAPPGGGSRADRFPAYLDLVRRQLRRGDGGPRQVPTALELRIQLAAERALTAALAGSEGLQGAVVVADRGSGELLAAVGGVPVAFPGFNRTIDARRQIGSVIKPFYYWRALASGRFHLLSPLGDGPLTVPTDTGELWRPENFDGRSAGTVALVDALAHSRNRASVRLGLSIGPGAVSEALAALGGRGVPGRHPAMLLGAVERAPLEVAQLYLSLARAGEPTPLTAIARRPLASPAPAAAAYLVEAALVRAVEDGTGRGFAPAAGGTLAGKTGTTNDGRDAWFAGWTRDHVLVVWIGRDDNAAAGLTGSGAAGPVVAALAPTLLGGPVQGPPPRGVRLAPVDPARARRIDAPCPQADHLPFVAARLPAATAPCPPSR